MSLNLAPSGERIHIGFFGCRNAGKSSTVNAVTGQPLSIVSETAGTTTDSVSKAMELLPLGPVVVTDTPGIDDSGELGGKRVLAAKRTLSGTDAAVLVSDASRGLNDSDYMLLSLFEEKNIPYIIAMNKSDVSDSCQLPEKYADRTLFISAKENTGISELKDRLAKITASSESSRKIVGDLLDEGSTALLVVPIDKAAPKGRLILPQQLTIRDLLDSGCIPVVCRDTELERTLSKLKEPPAIVITDSQAFSFVSSAVSEDIPLTSFSILMARYKGFLHEAVKGAAVLSQLEDGDRILISEGCTHHRQCGDIGTEKLPKWITQFSGKSLDFSFSSGKGFPDSEALSDFRLAVHCGGCMLNETEMKYRMASASGSGIPFTNYGTAIAYINGILERSLRPFDEVHQLLPNSFNR